MGRAAASPSARRSPPQLDAALGGNAYREAHARGRGDARRPRAHALGARARGDGRGATPTPTPPSPSPSRARTAPRIAALPLPADVAQRYAAMAVESLALQKRMEERDKVPFEDWRRRYLSLEMLRP